MQHQQLYFSPPGYINASAGFLLSQSPVFHRGEQVAPVAARTGVHGGRGPICGGMIPATSPC